MANLVFYLDDGSTFTHPLEEETTSVGRHPDSVVVLEFPSVSGHHATIELREDGYYLVDHKSSNGTRVNGAEIEEARLNDGDRVSFGDVQSAFYEGDPPAVLTMPAPDIVVDDPPPAPATTYRPAPVTRAPGRRIVPKNYGDDPDGGCLTAIIIFALFLAAFCAGLFLRHSNETGGNLFNDILDKLDKTELPASKSDK